jgi:hypothetical protein
MMFKREDFDSHKQTRVISLQRLCKLGRLQRTRTVQWQKEMESRVRYAQRLSKARERRGVQAWTQMRRELYRLQILFSIQQTDSMVNDPDISKNKLTLSRLQAMK